MFTEAELTAAMAAISAIYMRHDVASPTLEMARAALFAVTALRTLNIVGDLAHVPDHSLILDSGDVLYMVDQGDVIPWYPAVPPERHSPEILKLPAWIVKRGPE